MEIFTSLFLPVQALPPPLIGHFLVFFHPSVAASFSFVWLMLCVCVCRGMGVFVRFVSVCSSRMGVFVRFFSRVTG